jgi:hypothetical protein
LLNVTLICYPPFVNYWPTSSPSLKGKQFEEAASTLVSCWNVSDLLLNSKTACMNCLVIDPEDRDSMFFKHHYTSARLHGVTLQKIVLLMLHLVEKGFSPVIRKCSSDSSLHSKDWNLLKYIHNHILLYCGLSSYYIV